MAVEARRGCGYRKVGGLYLCGSGIWVACDRLPFEVGFCPVCGEGIHFPRSPKEINPLKLFGIHEDCRDTFDCHMCNPTADMAYLWGVGEKYYTPQEFITEAQTMGVSKRIPSEHIPKKLKLGETWVYLVHRKAIYAGKDDEGNDIHKMAIFAAFVPQRIEMPIYKSKLTKRKRKELDKRGITPIEIPDGDPDHAPIKTRKRR
jgi:hypothetical protein